MRLLLGRFPWRNKLLGDVEVHTLAAARDAMNEKVDMLNHAVAARDVAKDCVRQAERFVEDLANRLKEAENFADMKRSAMILTIDRVDKATADVEQAKHFVHACSERADAANTVAAESEAEEAGMEKDLKNIRAGKIQRIGQHAFEMLDGLHVKLEERCAPASVLAEWRQEVHDAVDSAVLSVVAAEKAMGAAERASVDVELAESQQTDVVITL